MKIAERIEVQVKEQKLDFDFVYKVNSQSHL